MNKSDDLISRKVAIDDLKNRDPSQIWDTADIEVWLNALPSAKSERKVGHWIDDCTCSVCHWIHEDNKGFALLTNYPFCPNCGVRMRGKEDG